MKKSPPSSVASSSTSAASRFWRWLAIVSLAVNIGLAVWATRRAKAADERATVVKETEAAAVSMSSAVASASIARPKPKGAYAALGSYMAENNRIADLGWSEAQFAEFLDGMRASYEGRGLPLDEEAKALRDEISRRVQAMLAVEQPDPVEDYFRMLRDKEGASRTGSGLHYRMTETGAGPTAQATDVVVLSFAARQPDGKELPELSRARVRMKVADLLPGLAEGVQRLNVGGKALMFLPASLSFSAANWPAQVPEGMPLAFFVELHEIEPSDDLGAWR